MCEVQCFAIAYHHQPDGALHGDHKSTFLHVRLSACPHLRTSAYPRVRKSACPHICMSACPHVCMFGIYGYCYAVPLCGHRFKDIVIRILLHGYYCVDRFTVMAIQRLLGGCRCTDFAMRKLPCGFASCVGSVLAGLLCWFGCRFFLSFVLLLL